MEGCDERKRPSALFKVRLYLSPVGRDAGESTAASHTPPTKTTLTWVDVCAMLTECVKLPADGAVGFLHPDDANLKDKIQKWLGWLGDWNICKRILLAALNAHVALWW